ncbi:MAG TPA: hypothetical protein VLF39_00990 [Candidatus Saccharimonadales bacterium]|nr:hypothetical protein [Candidatus Saccharimonadales bacterium]
MRLAIITCYKQPDYVRAVTLRRALALNQSIEITIIKNRQTNWLRYPEVMVKLIWLRLTQRPDIYVLTFRGYEILPFVKLLSWPRPLIYDEFVNPLEWLAEPRPEFWVKLIPKSLLKRFYRQLLNGCRYVLADTDVHADYSSKLLALPQEKFVALPVSTDENLFLRLGNESLKTTTKFSVFYYGNMLPLHGLEYVLAAAETLKDRPIEFRIIGGNQRTQMMIDKAVGQGANIKYQSWVKFDKLPPIIQQADLCLGGPFGNTNQAKYVITGKTYQFLASSKPTLVGNNLASDLFKDKNNCLKVPLADSHALVEAIIWAFDHPKQLNQIGKSGQKLYLVNFSNKILADKLNKLIKQLP